MFGKCVHGHTKYFFTTQARNNVSAPVQSFCFLVLIVGHKMWLFFVYGLFKPSPPLIQVSWSPDSSQLISASGDKTVKLWDVGAGTAVTTFNMGTEVSDLQQGCLWQKDHLLSVSLSGYINYLDKNNPNRPLRIIKVSVSSTEGTIPEILAGISCDV